MNKFKNEIYVLVDESFLSNFNIIHRQFMRKIYYKQYLDFCKEINMKPQSEELFLKNANRKRIRLFQLCCPVCHTITIFCIDNKVHSSKFNYCCHCGRGSVLENINNQISRYKRIWEVNKIGLGVLKNKVKGVDDWIISYDCCQMQIVEIATLIEIFVREYFFSLLFIEESKHCEFVNKIIKQHTRNDFMNIEKANYYYKKAFNINLKQIINGEIWKDLLDIVNLRNMIIHNNGMIDKEFELTETYNHSKEKVIGKLYKLENKDIKRYFSNFLKALNIMTLIYLNRYTEKRCIAIANHYFNIEEYTSDTKN